MSYYPCCFKIQTIHEWAINLWIFKKYFGLVASFLTQEQHGATSWFCKLSKKRDQVLMKPHWNEALEGLILVLVMTWNHSIQGKLVFLGPILKRAAIDQNKSQVPQADSSLQFPTSWEHLRLIPSCDWYESIATLYKTVAAIHPSNRKLEKLSLTYRVVIAIDLNQLKLFIIQGLRNMNRRMVSTRFLLPVSQIQAMTTVDTGRDHRVKQSVLHSSVHSPSLVVQFESSKIPNSCFNQLIHVIKICWCLLVDLLIDLLLLLLLYRRPGRRPILFSLFVLPAPGNPETRVDAPLHVVGGVLRFHVGNACLELADALGLEAILQLLQTNAMKITNHNNHAKT